MKKLTALALILFGMLAFAQTDNTSVHRWKPLSISEKEKIWYDAAMVDSVKGDKLNMWILQMHKPPLTFENIKGEIYRSKTLYTISLKTVRYGIKQVVYYDVTNKEISSFDYPIDSYPDNVKYTYPIMENSFLYTLLKELFHK
ncbi:MAG: hypothetical protein ACM3RX_07080 [Methanococcaceae archaeon]